MRDCVGSKLFLNPARKTCESTAKRDKKFLHFFMQVCVFTDDALWEQYQHSYRLKGQSTFVKNSSLFLLKHGSQ